MVVFLTSLCLILANLHGGLADGTGTPETTQSYPDSFRTHFILHHDVLSDVNCIPPPDANNTEKTTRNVDWEPPTGVTFVSTNVRKLSSEPTTSGEADPDKRSSAWVELTSDGVLRFHYPDDSVRGPYTCRVLRDGQLDYTTVIWVHVFPKSVFAAGHRILVGIIATVVFALVVIAIFAGERFYRRHSPPRYSIAAQEEHGVDLKDNNGFKNINVI